MTGTTSVTRILTASRHFCCPLLPRVTRSSVPSLSTASLCRFPSSFVCSLGPFVPHPPAFGLRPEPAGRHSLRHSRSLHFALRLSLRSRSAPHVAPPCGAYVKRARSVSNEGHNRRTKVTDGGSYRFFSVFALFTIRPRSVPLVRHGLGSLGPTGHSMLPAQPSYRRSFTYSINE